ncbi:MAG: hypothetical protein UR62_C0005G0022 [Candidatus Nomurabacteria bacterium GW2011_GWF2_35_12]|uniref:Uncharacterized protein n=3 Tax=Candidatus Nomuraibacteriota TaxID=1752729 RepID=A0A0G0DV72_9BACT|nr:MAG: hypothetical protein UR62_C0005G0022 [Candidatus Nomurabacteria bacterium GW2011_GWF2_35_12]KKP72421.1 MAG: hypothetical protein UR70_C0008G0013 [Candidatus Nomurabacteria bacterium GW2011_GWB1_35_20]KKP75123.1 MAG: hypothetical protein UR72_C0006G0019 [Parcubacteria group bacterium GW2011_GWC1_35_21]KKP78244.1 MAG: hypothetical protein UR77_C0005G0019 [Candidatus Nomurabacteria bacterium GW2011_GWC2_35_35]KKP85342.1 MAG: hypothetical protein UR86_C0007G0004 [Parcubacteria group bacteri
MDLLFTNIAYASVDSFVSNVNRLIINPLIILLFGLAVVYFLYGIFEFISNQENEEKKTTGKNHMIWGIIGIVIMMGVFTILNIIMRTFNIEGINPEEGTVQLNDYNP